MTDRVAGPAVTVLLSLVAMAQALRVWQWRPGDPVDLAGDSPAGLAQFKSLLDHGTVRFNSDLSAPFYQDASWFPHADHLHLLVLRLLGLFSDNVFTVSAIYFFLGFPLAALSMYWLARQLDIGRLGSVVAGVLFSVVPGHQTMFQHLMLASYWVVPLGMWLVVRATLGQPLFLVRTSWKDAATRRPALLLNLTTAFCVLCIAIGGIYYSAFTLLLLAVTLFLRRVATGNPGALARGALVPAAIGLVSLGAVVSIAAGQDKSTLVTASGQRSFAESEIFAGKLMDLILPWTDHRVDALQYLTVAYNARTTPTPEEPALGIVALVGVAALLVIMTSALVPHRAHPTRPQLGVLGVLTVVALSFYSIGGLGSFVALFATAQIRTWSRLFVVIALCGLLAVGHWVGVVNGKRRVLGLLTAGALLIIGVLDTTNPAMAPNYKALRNEVTDLAVFSRSIEAQVGSGCSVFQLPIVPYPEYPIVYDMGSYAHFRPYLTPTSLRWSYGGFRGTSLADWQLALPKKSTTALLDDLASAGFCAVELDRAGFADRAADLESELTTLLGPTMSRTRDDRLLAWDLRQARAALTSRVGAAQVETTGDLVLHPVVVYSDRGAYDVETGSEPPYQWTGPSPEINVHNFGRTTLNGVRLTFSLASPDARPRRFTVRLPDGSTQVIDVNGGRAKKVQAFIKAAPGRNAVTITTTGPGQIPENPAAAIGEIKVFGKLIDLQARTTDPKVHVGVLQQQATSSDSTK